MSDPVIDVHQHLWPAQLIELLRLRTVPPMLRGWTLHTEFDPPYDLRAADHDPELRAKLTTDVDIIVLSMSTPIGIEALEPAVAAPLLASWHDGIAELGGKFRGWAAVPNHEPDAHELKNLLDRGFVGLQLGADQLVTPAALERAAPLLEVCQNADVPVLVHPGPAAKTSPDQPGWWSAVVDYPSQLQSAWWSWFAVGRSLLPTLRVCFVAGAGLAPAHVERFAARSGGPFVLDRDVFVDTSSYGPRGLDSLLRVLGVDNIVFGSDGPYAQPTDPQAGPEATRALRVINPRRLLKGDQP